MLSSVSAKCCGEMPCVWGSAAQRQAAAPRWLLTSPGSWNQLFLLLVHSLVNVCPTSAATLGPTPAHRSSRHIWGAQIKLNKQRHEMYFCRSACKQLELAAVWRVAAVHSCQGAGVQGVECPFTAADVFPDDSVFVPLHCCWRFADGTFFTNPMFTSCFLIMQCLRHVSSLSFVYVKFFSSNPRYTSRFFYRFYVYVTFFTNPN